MRGGEGGQINEYCTIGKERVKGRMISTSFMITLLYS